jgi:hypothetical protein
VLVYLLAERLDHVGIAMPEDPAVEQAGVLCTGTAMLEQDAVPGPSVWGAIAGTAKYTFIVQKGINEIMLDEQLPLASNYQ